MASRSHVLEMSHSPCSMLHLRQRLCRDLHPGMGIKGFEPLGRGAGSSRNGLLLLLCIAFHGSFKLSPRCSPPTSLPRESQR